MTHNPPPDDPSPVSAEAARRPHSPLPARWAALRVLSDLREGRRTAREGIDALIEAAGLATQEAGLTTELVMGVVRHRLTLARVIGAFASQGWQRIGHRVQQVLMVAAYQLIWMDTIPAFAAVNEAVEQAKAEGGDKVGRFVNGLLRSLLRDIEALRVPRAQADPRRAVPVNHESACLFRRPILTDPSPNPVAHLSEATSHPTWLVGRWAHTYGRLRADGICRAGMSRPTLFLRPNRLRISPSGLSDRLRHEGFETQPGPAGVVAVTGHTAGLMRSASFVAGLFQPQDPTAAKAALAMKPARGQTILDLCAGVGTKTSQMAEIMQNQGLILATDKDAGRLKLLAENCSRLGITMVRPTALDTLPDAVAALSRLDWILIDAPCSNTGVLSRRPEARYRVDRRSIEALQARQAALMEQAAGLARPETRLLYSTCSIEPEENEMRSHAFAAAHPGWTVTQSELTLPSAEGPVATWHDGGYWSAWVRK